MTFSTSIPAEMVAKRDENGNFIMITGEENIKKQHDELADILEGAK